MSRDWSCTKDSRLTGQVIDPASGVWFILDLINLIASPVKSYAKWSFCRVMTDIGLFLAQFLFLFCGNKICLNQSSPKTLDGSYMTISPFRPLAYSTLADLVHHVRTSLSLNDLSLAVNLFSKNVHDESLSSNIQTMSCKLLLNLVECIRTKSETDNGNVSYLL